MAVIPIIVICRPKREARVAEIVAGIIRYAIKIVVSLSQRQSTITCSHGCKQCGHLGPILLMCYLKQYF